MIYTVFKKRVSELLDSIRGKAILQYVGMRGDRAYPLLYVEVCGEEFLVRHYEFPRLMVFKDVDVIEALFVHTFSNTCILETFKSYSTYKVMYLNLQAKKKRSWCGSRDHEVLAKAVNDVIAASR